MDDERSQREQLDKARRHLEVAARSLAALKALLGQVVPAQGTRPDWHTAGEEA